jgi:deaminated glutathione amidase
MRNPDERQLRVAAAQLMFGEHVEENLAKILETMRYCAAEGVEIVVFPETALSGYSPAIGHGRGLAEWPSIEDGLKAIAQCAQALDMAVVVGTEAWDGEAWRNRLYAYSGTGQVMAVYDKVHLTEPDTHYYKPGAHYPVFEMKGIQIGLQICYDVRFPEGYRALLAQGVEVVLQGFYGAGGDTWKVPVIGAHLRSRAAESGCFLVASNVAGPLQISVSQIVDPLGLILAEANQDHEETLMANLKLGRIADSEIRRDYGARFCDSATVSFATGSRRET